MLDDGSVRLVGRTTRGFAAVARTPAELARAVEATFTEASVAAYSRWHGVPYDLDALTAVDGGDREGIALPRDRRGDRRRLSRGHRPGDGWGEGQQRPDVHPIEQWQRLGDGSWRSPGGRTYGAGTPQAARCRRRAGLADPPE